MEFRDLKAQYEKLKPAISKAMLRVASDARFIMGPDVAELEKELAEFVGAEHCITCANGTDALQIALMIWEVGPGDAVFVPDFTFFSSAEVVAAVGAEPVFVDVRKDTFNMDPGDLIKAIEETQKEGRLKPKAVIAVDLFGLPADYENIRKIADKHDLKLLEDGAQGFGGNILSKKSCSFGDISTTSFFPAKPLGCYGDGGAIFTDSEEWAELARSYRFHGKGSYKYDNVRIGMNSRLDTLQAAILRVKLDAFKEELRKVQHFATRYDLFLGGIPELKTPEIPFGCKSSWAQYTIRLKDRQTRDTLQQQLKEQDIPSMVYYPTPMSGQTAFAGYRRRICTNAEELCDTVLSLPIHPYLKEKDQDTVVNAIRKFFNVKTI